MKKESGVMVSMYMFERLFYNSENINACSFPVLSECEFMNMEIEAFHDSESVRCFAYYRHSGSNAYIDIYVWDIMLQSRYKRFVIAEDYSFSQEDEKLFLEYMSGNGYGRMSYIDIGIWTIYTVRRMCGGIKRYFGLM